MYNEACKIYSSQIANINLLCADIYRNVIITCADNCKCIHYWHIKYC